MNDREVVKEALQTLKAIRKGTYGEVEDGVADWLDQVIQSMELLAVHDSRREAAQSALVILGHVIELVGVATTVMDLMSRSGK